MATRKTKVGKPKKAFTAIIKEAEFAMNFSWGNASSDDGNGNEVEVFIWISGDWKVNYKGKEYIIPMEENINALINWINGEQS